MILHSITHYIDTNTLEAVWLKLREDESGYDRARVTSYSSEQRAEFIADTGAPQYADLAGWPE